MERRVIRCKLHDYYLKTYERPIEIEIPPTIWEVSDECGETCSKNKIEVLKRVQQNFVEHTNNIMKEENAKEFGECTIHCYAAPKNDNLQIPSSIYKFTPKCDDKCVSNKVQFLENIKYLFVCHVDKLLNEIKN